MKPGHLRNGGASGGGRYPEHELWEAVEGYLDLLDATEEPGDLPVTTGTMDLPPR